MVCSQLVEVWVISMDYYAPGRGSSQRLWKKVKAAKNWSFLSQKRCIILSLWLRMFLDSARKTLSKLPWMKMAAWILKISMLKFKKLNKLAKFL